MQDETLIPDERGEPQPDALNWVCVGLTVIAIAIGIVCTILAWPTPIK